MNINEVEKHIKFDMLITILCYIGIFVCLIISLFAILSTPVKAMENTTDITSSIVSNYDCPFGSFARGYCAINQNQTGGVRSFNTRYNGVLNVLSFAFPYYFNANGRSQQVIDIYSTTNDFRNNNVYAYCSSFETSPSQAVTNNCTYRFISKQHIQVVMAYDIYQWHEIQIIGTAVTGDTNYLVKNITITYDDGQQDLGGIINNATSNTTDIINNNNQNTIDIINAINNNTADLCTNIFNASDYSNAYNGAIIQNINPNEITIYSNSVWGWLQYQLITTSGTTYKINGQARCNNSSSTALIQVCADPDCANMLYQYENNGTLSGTFTASGSITYFRLFGTKGVAPQTSNYYQIMISENDTIYCPFGSYVSKQDKANQLSQQQLEVMERFGITANDTNSYLKDDSDPTLNQQGINDLLGDVEVSDPLNYLLTLPISLLQKLNTVLSSNTCQRVSFGSLYNTEIYLPCIDFSQILGSSIWGTIDLIVGVGLLAIILKKFYESISNILTLGKEKEVKEKLDLPTPMEFLAHILGGGRD